MSAPHFFAPSVDRDDVLLEDEEAFHASKVLRVRPGETITVSDGRGAVVEASVSSVAPRALHARVVARRTIPRPRPAVWVLPALPKGGKLELVVQKLTELGIDRIWPWPAHRSVVQWNDAKARAHGERLRVIAREAAKQSRRAWLPEVDDPAPIGALPPLAVVLHEQETATRLSDVLSKKFAGASEIAVVVGPEGGLTDDEVGSLLARGAYAAGLGPQILRAETAAIAAAALVLGWCKRLG